MRPYICDTCQKTESSYGPIVKNGWINRRSSGLFGGNHDFCGRPCEQAFLDQLDKDIAKAEAKINSQLPKLDNFVEVVNGNQP